MGKAENKGGGAPPRRVWFRWQGNDTKPVTWQGWVACFLYAGSLYTMFDLADATLPSTVDITWAHFAPPFMFVSLLFLLLYDATLSE